MRSITIKFYFKDEELKEIEDLAERLEISTRELISEFLTEGISSSWNAYEYEAKKKDQIKFICKKYGITLKELEELKESLKNCSEEE